MSCCRLGLWLLCVLGLLANALAQDAVKPVVLYAVPPAIVRGEKTKLALRGLQLDQAAKLKLVGVEPEIVLTPKPGKVAVPNGLEAAKVGDAQVETEFTLPEASTGESVEFVVETATGEKTSIKIPVIEKAAFVAEKEPNQGFVQAQPLAVGQVVRGMIQEARDVDVFRIEVKAGQKLLIELWGERLGTPLDGAMAIYDDKGRRVAANDDRHGRDPQLEQTVARDGVWYLSVIDANDAGSGLHGYVLKLKSGG